MQEKVFIPNKKGLKLATIVDKPSKKGKYSCVLLLHGFKGYKEEETYSELAKELLKESIVSVRFDASGFGESEGNFQEEYRLTNYVNDTESVYKWLVSQGFVDKNKIGVMGQSMGGAQALIFSSNHPEIRVVVSVSPPDLFATKDDFGRRLKEWKEKGYIEIDSSRMGKIKVPYEYVLDAQKYDIRDFARKIKLPKLFVLGLSDIIVDPEQTRAVYRAANHPKKLLEVKSMGHFYKKDIDLLENVNTEIVKYLRKYI